MSRPAFPRALLCLQRVYGITFPDKELMADYKHRMEEAKKRDHRAQGTRQELFFFDKLSPGSCFFLPNGARIYSTLIEVGRLLVPASDLPRLLSNHPENNCQPSRISFKRFFAVTLCPIVYHVGMDSPSG